MLCPGAADALTSPEPRRKFNQAIPFYAQEAISNRSTDRRRRRRSRAESTCRPGIFYYASLHLNLMSFVFGALFDLISILCGQSRVVACIQVKKSRSLRVYTALYAPNEECTTMSLCRTSPRCQVHLITRPYKTCWFRGVKGKFFNRKPLYGVVKGTKRNFRTRSIDRKWPLLTTSFFN